MTHESTVPRTRDILGNRSISFLLYGVPTLVLIATGSLGGGNQQLLAMTRSLAFLVMGTACMANAVRCGRIHCYFMGPFLLLLALASLLHGLGLLSLGVAGWQVISVSALIGVPVLYFVPERIWGRYVDRR